MFFSCKSIELSKMKDEFQQIKTILDKALLSDDPIASFHNALPKIRNLSSVDIAWIRNKAFLVKFKSGGIISWIINQDNLN